MIDAVLMWNEILVYKYLFQNMSVKVGVRVRPFNQR
jgi:hypothetical protein